MPFFVGFFAAFLMEEGQQAVCILNPVHFIFTCTDIRKVKAGFPGFAGGLVGRFQRWALFYLH